jgi:hypothetical protein
MARFVTSPITPPPLHRRYCSFFGHPNPWQLTKREARRWIEERKAHLNLTAHLQTGLPSV